VCWAMSFAAVPLARVKQRACIFGKVRYEAQAGLRAACTCDERAPAPHPAALHRRAPAGR
jgi:hypothetical protein